MTVFKNRWIATKVVFDMETLKVVEKQAYAYCGPVDEAKAFAGGGTATADNSSGDEKINSLLGGDLAVAEEDTAVAEDTSVADPAVESEDELEEAVETGDESGSEEEQGEEAGSEEGSEEEETGEEDFDVADLETDFADSAYEKAATHYSKQFGKTLDPNDQGDRALLRELMDRGRKISELSASREEAEEEPEEETAPAKEKEAPEAKTPDQVVMGQLESARNYAKSNVNPIVLKEAIFPMMGAMAKFFWGDKAKQFLEGKRPEDVMELAQAMDTVMTLKGMEIAGGILPNVGKAVESAYPFFSKSQDLAEKEAAVDEILGDAAYKGFDKLVDSGAINRALASPELKDAVFSKDAFKNRVAKLKFAFKLARNERVDPKVLGEAVKRGREQANDRARKVAAGRTLPGSSNRGAVPAGRGKFINDLVGNSGSRAAKLFRNVGRRAE
jgi:hypothetical protein